MARDVSKQRRLVIHVIGACTKSSLSIPLLVFITYFFTARNLIRAPLYSPPFSAAVDGKLDAIVTVALCGYHANDFVESLRGIGEWKGPIYVITDTPNLENTNLCSTIDVKDVQPHFATHEEFDIYQNGLNQTQQLWSKWFKSQVLNLLPSDLKNIMYLDTDIVAMRSLNDGWLQDVAPLVASPRCDFATYKERWYTSLPILGNPRDRHLMGKYYSAIMLLKRGYTDIMLNKWSDLMVHAPIEPRDQRKLRVAVEETNRNVCWQPTHWKHLQNAPDIADKIWFSLRGKKPTFFHMASAKLSDRSLFDSHGERLHDKCEYSTFEFQGV